MWLFFVFFFQNIDNKTFTFNSSLASLLYRSILAANDWLMHLFESFNTIITFFTALNYAEGINAL